MTAAPSPFSIDELRDKLEQIDGGAWRVERTLRSTAFVETQVVYRNGSEAGPFIRKLIAGSIGQGSAYETLFQAQSSGKRFSHVPFIYDCTRTANGIAVVMEYIQGKTLREYVADIGPGDRALRFAAPALCEALEEIHSALDVPIIHRDIKPGNVMLSPSGLVFIDLDITRFWQEGAERDTTRFGTPGYAPPEQFGFGQTGVASDIFAAGMTLAFCCTGEEPTAQLRESGFDDPRVPNWIRPVLVRATQFDPAARFQSAREMGDAVKSALMGRGDSAPQPASASRPAAEPRGKAAARANAREAGVAFTQPPTRVYAQAPASGEPVSRLVLKYAWNALVLATTIGFLVMLTASIGEVVSQPNHGLAELFQHNPLAAIVAVIEIVVVYAMVLLVCYLALFKIHLRKFKPFSLFTWRQELPIGIAAIVFVWVVVGLINPVVSG